MGRLKTRPARLPSVSPRIGAMTHDPKSHDRARNQEKPWRSWYSRKRWKDIKAFVFAREQGVCQQTGIALLPTGTKPNSAVADHIQEHNGDPSLFWDPDNVQLVSKEYHDGEKQRIERARHA